MERIHSVEREVNLRSSPPPTIRVVREGKFLSLEGSPFRVRGATYGSFLPRSDGELFPTSATIERDFMAMRAAGLNTVRTYSAPPSDLLELAEENGIRVLAGVHYLDWRMDHSNGPAVRERVLRAGRRAVDAAMERLAGRPGVLAISVGNEVPSDVVRLQGISAVEDALSRLVEQVHAADPDMLATYCNYPSTEYLRVEGQDLVCFNVFLEQRLKLESYLRRLQTAAGPLPLLLTELGLSGAAHGDEEQAASLEWQLNAADEVGCVGATVFSWTDDWAVGGCPVDGWGFGMTTKDRVPKPALEVLSCWARSEPRDLRADWPRISAVVCARNEERTIARCLGSLQHTGYPNLEIILCDDGSTDRTLDIARNFKCIRLELPHGGLSVARNAGLAAATGMIVAYIDADARCHADWPYHLALAFDDPQVGAAGGPNLPVPEAGFVERAIAMCPGGPTEVLLSDDRAEHVPGCNLAVRADALRAIGGFDPIFTAAGDDVDVCWKLSDAGYRIAFSAAAQVLHHRRGTVRQYLRQQRTYGRSERMVSRAHPHRFNRMGQARWAGFIYGYPRILPALLRPVVYHGDFGSAPYQGIVRRPADHVFARCLTLLPLSVPIALAGLLLALVSPAWLALSVAVLCGLACFLVAVAFSVSPGHREARPIALRLLVGSLHILQPLVRTWGRLRDRSQIARLAVDRSWSGDRLQWLGALSRDLSARHCSVIANHPYQDWDLAVRIGPLVTCRLTTAVLWGWNPVLKRGYGPGPFLLPAALLPALLALVGLPRLAGLVAAGVLLILAGETILLRHLITKTVADTTPRET